MYWDNVKVGLWIFLIAVTMFVGIMLLANVGARASCDAMTVQMGFPHRYSFLSGCMIEVKAGQWIPLSNYYYKQP